MPNVGAGHFRQNKRTNIEIKHRYEAEGMTPEEKKELVSVISLTLVRFL